MKTLVGGKHSNAAQSDTERFFQDYMQRTGPPIDVADMIDASYPNHFMHSRHPVIGVSSDSCDEIRLSIDKTVDDGLPSNKF